MPLPAALRRVWPGLLACGVVAAAASFLSEHYGAPVMLFALLIGMAMNFLSQGGPCLPGIEFAARTVLRVGVALLGLRITTGQVAALGWQPVLVVVLGVVLTMAVAMLAARWLGCDPILGLLSGGATAICGASAALALSAALPDHPQRERATLFTVIGVSALATVTMVTWPMLAASLGLDARTAGVFLGATIHDVAQVVGAGYGMSRETGDVATVVKLMRVAMLVPVVAFAALLTRAGARRGSRARPALLPGFVLGFVALVVANSLGLVPTFVTGAGTELSRWCLVAAIAGIGMKTKLDELLTVGMRPVLLMLGETVFLTGLVLLLLH
jgi:uncharacterized integral membrane protein (TIGR00698 family)